MGYLMSNTTSTQSGSLWTDRDLQSLVDQISSGQLTNLQFLLPLFFRLEGKPYTLKNHFVFSPLFDLKAPQTILIKAGRQVSKTTTLASRSILFSIMIPYFSVLYVTPLQEQAQRFSSYYLKPFLDESPIRPLILDSSCDDRVFSRSFKNHSRITLSYALISVRQTRGIQAHMLCIDEVQDMRYDFVPVLMETLSASKYGWKVFAGTPLTLDNTIEQLWQSSSQCEWVIKCPACSYWNIPSIQHDAIKMIGPYSPDISEELPGVVCAKCSRPLPVRQGQWVPRYPDKHDQFCGYHIPQIILPMHYANPNKWRDLILKREGAFNYSQARWWNEVMGESFDVGAKIVSLADLQAACSLPYRVDCIDDLLPHLDEYDLRLLGVDWGGGGSDEVSFTVVSLVGVKGRYLHVLYGKRLLLGDAIAEIKEVLRLFHLFRCHFLCHDYIAAGSVRDSVLIQGGLPIEQVIPIQYVAGAQQGYLVYKPPTETHPRFYYLLDKPRSLTTLCQAIRTGWVKFFQWEHGGETLVRDFLALIEHVVERPFSSAGYTISRTPGLSDDFAHACNFAASYAWHVNNAWPDIAGSVGVLYSGPKTDISITDMDSLSGY